MKRISTIVGLALFLVLPSWALAQQSTHSLDHGEVGIYADYFRFAPSHASDNYVGVGARVAFNVHPNVALEAEMNYDFARNFTTTTTNGATTTFVKTSVRPITGLFGPKFQFGTSGPIRAFLTGKVGFIDYTTNNTGVVSGGTFTSGVSGVGGAGTHLALYPGGGLEAFIGPIGLRLDAGDEVYVINGNTFNNLRVTFGPHIRF
ncbi:MAG TPA: outer membrane beta-barrel protein [Silvibacterium sp.]|nr:outer membrane beta-barrel protein [Silvibacterium sp.]